MTMRNRTLDYSTSDPAKKILISEEQDGMMMWLGDNEHIHKTAGQVFYNGTAGSLESVAILPQATMADSRLSIEIHAFDPETKTWGALLGEAEVQVKQSDCEEWLFFTLHHEALQAGQWYGFKLICKQGQVAIAEGHRAGTKDIQSMQWTANTASDQGVFHSDFHLAYMVEVAA